MLIFKNTKFCEFNWSDLWDRGELGAMALENGPGTCLEEQSYASVTLHSHTMIDNNGSDLLCSVNSGHFAPKTDDLFLISLQISLPLGWLCSSANKLLQGLERSEPWPPLLSSIVFSSIRAECCVHIHPNIQGKHTSCFRTRPPVDIGVKARRARRRNHH